MGHRVTSEQRLILDCLSHLQQYVDFMRFVSPTDEETDQRRDAVERVTSVITGIWPGSQVHAYGLAVRHRHREDVFIKQNAYY